jgi:hypothetical protein
VSNAIKFRYEDGTTSLGWETGESVDNAVWITVFLIIVVLVNMLPVRVRTPTGVMPTVAGTCLSACMGC